MTEENYNELVECYGFLFCDELIEEISNLGVFHTLKAGSVIIDYGQKISQMPLLFSGAIKILRQDDFGDELALYYLERGDTCSITMSCCLNEKESNIRAVAETDIRFITIPSKYNKSWIQKYDGWIKFVFESYNNRIDELLTSVDELAFGNMQKRLRKYLKDQVLIKKSKLLDISHQDIAYDMHSSRVVISRLLKKLEKENVIQLKRNRIELLEL